MPREHKDSAAVAASAAAAGGVWALRAQSQPAPPGPAMALFPWRQGSLGAGISSGKH